MSSISDNFIIIDVKKTRKDKVRSISLKYLGRGIVPEKEYLFFVR